MTVPPRTLQKQSELYTQGRFLPHPLSPPADNKLIINTSVDAQEKLFHHEPEFRSGSPGPLSPSTKMEHEEIKEGKEGGRKTGSHFQKISGNMECGGSSSGGAAVAAYRPPTLGLQGGPPRRASAAALRGATWASSLSRPWWSAAAGRNASSRFEQLPLRAKSGSAAKCFLPIAPRL